MISIIIPTYNCERYIEKSLNSVFEQTLPEKNYEIIVINDGSTDGTLNILDRYCEKIELIDQPNKGLVYSCNRAIQKSKGDYIIRLDADDYFDKNLLSLSLNILENKTEYHCVYTDRFEINVADNKPIKVSVGKDNVFDMIACGILFRKEVFDKINLYRDLLFEEYDFMIRFYNNNFKGYYLQKPLYYYIKHDSNMTIQNNYWEKGWKQLLDIWNEKELKRYIDIQIKTKGISKFQTM